MLQRHVCKKLRADAVAQVINASNRLRSLSSSTTTTSVSTTASTGSIVPLSTIAPIAPQAITPLSMTDEEGSERGNYFTAEEDGDVLGSRVNAPESPGLTTRDRR